jgi:hypothetical protein
MFPLYDLSVLDAIFYNFIEHLKKTLLVQRIPGQAQPNPPILFTLVPQSSLNSLFGVQSLENGTRFRMRALSKLT